MLHTILPRTPLPRHMREHKKLPSRICITDAAYGDTLQVISMLPAGVAVIIRDYHHPDRAGYAQQIIRLCHKQGLQVLVAGDVSLARSLDADGIHLPKWCHRRLQYLRCAHPGWVITAAAHDLPTASRLFRYGADAVLYSPLFNTSSHPDVAPLGLMRFRQIVNALDGPVYALGGIKEDDCVRVIRAGAAGIAGISLFYRK